MAKQCLTRRHTPTREFQRQTGDRRVEKYFQARLPPKGRSEKDTLVAILVGRNGGHRKISPEKVPAARYSDGGYGFL